MTIEEAEEFGKYAEEYGTMCYSQHKIVASNGKKLLSLLQGKKSFYPLFTRPSTWFLPPNEKVSTFDEKLNLLI